MSQEIKQLEPKSLWNHFTEINSIPRPSKKEEKIIQFMIDFGNNLGFETIQDEVGNVLIKKPATSGMENRKTIVMQSHLDMVCQKNNEVNFNFDTQGIQMIIDQGFVKAQGTTLGADNGIGVAAIMAILSASNIEHPSIEALFTIDEETGMTGAKGLQPDFLTGNILLNLDTEEDDELDIGCAGGIDITATKNYTYEKTDSDFTSFKLTIKGLKGGHSGIDIHKGFGNANKILVRFLTAFSNIIVVNSIDGGGLRNAIPREAFAFISCKKENTNSIQSIFNDLKNAIVEEYAAIEKNISLTLEAVHFQEKQIPENESKTLIKTLQGLQNGVFRWSPDIADLVETSNNIARVKTENGIISLMCLTRSSVESSKKDLANSLQAVMELGGFSVKLSGDYPGWKPNSNSEILEVSKALYKDIFKQEPKVVACHAGLECGLIGSVYPTMDMISFGPNIFGAHSPDERVEIVSVQKFWKFLLEILKNIPLK